MTSIEISVGWLGMAGLAAMVALGRNVLGGVGLRVGAESKDSENYSAGAPTGRAGAPAVEDGGARGPHSLGLRGEGS
jgi:hypothetical protein